MVEGFYEWKREGKTKLSYYIWFKDGWHFAIAGLWERWEKQEPALETCALNTTVSNTCVTPIHDRMPMILPEQAYANWVNTGLNNLIYLGESSEPCQAGKMEAILHLSFS